MIPFGGAYVALEGLEHLFHAVTEKVLFEAPMKDQQAWLIRELGSNVNLGNIPPSDVLSLETLRTGLRADTVQLLGPAQDQRTPRQRNESPGWPPGIH